MLVTQNNRQREEARRSDDGSKRVKNDGMFFFVFSHRSRELVGKFTSMGEKKKLRSEGRERRFFVERRVRFATAVHALFQR